MNIKTQKKLQLSIPEEGKSKVLRSLLLPLARFCLRHAISLSEVQSMLKDCFVQAAAENIEKTGGKATSSAITVLTNLHRREVSRILRAQPSSRPVRGMISRILGQWQTHPLFSEKGKGKALDYGNEASSFAQLCQSVTKDLAPASILQELLRLQYVQEVNGKLELFAKVDSIDKDILPAFDLAGQEFDSLIRTIEQNLASPEKTHQARTVFTKIRSDKLPEIHTWIFREGSRFHELIRNFLAPYDTDVNPSVDSDVKTSLVSFSSWSTSEDGEDLPPGIS